MAALNRLASLDRREMLAAGTLAATQGLSLARPVSAADTIRLAVLGSGGRARHLMRSVVKLPGLELVALADVRDDQVATTRGHLRDIAPAKVEMPAVKDFRALLDRKDIDAVLIGSPDHWHAPMTIAACQAGKHVYVEKPLTHDPREAKALLDAQAASKSICQVGMQQRSIPHIVQAGELIRSGAIGRVHKVHLSWNRNTARFKKEIPAIAEHSVDWRAFVGGAPGQAYDPYKMVHWRWFWDFGGGIFTDLMVHWIDVAHALLDLKAPVGAASVGTFINAEGVWETPDSVQTLLSYPGGVTAHFEGTFSNARHGAMICFMGTEGSIYCDRGRMELIPDPNKPVKPRELVLGQGRRGADFYDQPDGELLHLTDWVRAVRAGTQPSAPLEAGITAANAAHLANRSLREKRMVTAG
ncbi:MAG: Gfo/Idh/MocA family protein [Gemmataceae bacterium]